MILVQNVDISWLLLKHSLTAMVLRVKLCLVFIYNNDNSVLYAKA